jgi:hypothetical protein
MQASWWYERARSLAVLTLGCVCASHRAQATALRKLAFEDFITLAKEKNLASLKLKKGRMLDKKRCARAPW